MALAFEVHTVCNGFLIYSVSYVSSMSVQCFTLNSNTKSDHRSKFFSTLSNWKEDLTYYVYKGYISTV